MRALVISVILSLAFTLLFSFAAQRLEFSNTALAIGNTAISISSIVLAAAVGLKTAKLGAVKGFFVGIIFIVATFYIYALMYGGDSGSISPYDIIFGSVAGVFAGILSVNLRK